MRSVEINKKRYAVSFNMAAWYDIEKEAGVSPSILFSGESIDAGVMLKLVFLAFKYGAAESRQRFDMTYPQFVEMIDANEDQAEEIAKMVTDDIITIITLQNERYKLSSSDTPVSAKKKQKPGTRPGDTMSVA